jgi:hypothetical protein
MYKSNELGKTFDRIPNALAHLLLRVGAPEISLFVLELPQVIQIFNGSILLLQA